MMRPEDRERAACAGTVSDLWIGPDDDDEPMEQIQWRYARAGQICATCPVQTACLADALTYPRAHQYGFIGGMSARQRIKLLDRWRHAGLIDARGRTREQVLDLLTHQEQVSA